MPEPVMALYLRLDMLTRRWMCLTPSQCRTSGMRTWKRMSAGDEDGVGEVRARLSSGETESVEM